MMGIMVILSRCTCGFFAYKVRTSLSCFTDESIHLRKIKTLRVRSLDTELLYLYKLIYGTAYCRYRVTSMAAKYFS
jgi:hypothetical protein